MKKLLMGSLMLGAALAASAEICVKDGEAVAFMGDSITQYGNKPVGYVNLVMKGLETAGVKDVKKIAAGISGNKAPQMHWRLNRDVLVKRPQWMTFSCGVNDVWHGKNGVPLDQYKKLVSEIFDRCAASNVNVIVLTATVIGEDLENANNKKLAPYNEWLRAEAKKRNLRLADLNADVQAEIKRIRAEDPKHRGYCLTSDGVHMAYPGNCVMAWGILRAMGVDPALKDKIFASFRDIPGAVDVRVSFSFNEWDKVQERAKAAKADPAKLGHDLLLGK